ncbi:MAG: hypothetical protein U0X73_02020 [Thermoanaerobaculia bacterium]
MIVNLGSKPLRSAAFGATAILQKELALPLVLWSVAGGTRRPADRALGRIAIALVPPALWWGLVHSHFSAPEPSSFATNFGWPAMALLRRWDVALSGNLGSIRTAKDLAFLFSTTLTLISGVLLGIAGLRNRRSRSAEANAASEGCLYFSTLGIFLSDPVWVEPWAYGRVLLPLTGLCLLAAAGHSSKSLARRLGFAQLALSALLGATYIGALLRLRVQ